MDALELLLHRNSSPKLTEPAPPPDALETMLSAACRAPDHAWLRPWRFLKIAGDARHRLGAIFADAAERRQGGLSDAERIKFCQQPLRAPLLLVAYAHLVEHPKVPVSEQRLSTACAAHSILLAAEALGYAGIWRTGVNAYDPGVHRGLGLGENEEIIGFLYLGTRQGGVKSLPALQIDDYLSSWE